MDSEGSGEDGCLRMMMINSPSSGMVANSTSDKVSASESINQLYGPSSTNWNLHGNFGDSSSAMAPTINSHLLQNQAMAPHIFPSHSGPPDMLPGSFYGQSGRWAGTGTQIPTTEDDCQISSQVMRKRKQAITEHKEVSKEEDEKQQKPEKAAAKAKDCPEPSKENYIHVRAKRGQATNSHSLAERVRREKISERMRLLQELVPGCNKITGKAMMLDEIINYVQSLQQQVEFLSMKLATVNPELNLDIDRILSKEILHSSAPIITSGLHAFPGYPSNSAPPLFPPPQFWNHELQGILHTGLDPDPSACSLGSNGLLKRAP